MFVLAKLFSVASLVLDFKFVREVHLSFGSMGIYMQAILIPVLVSLILFLTVLDLNKIVDFYALIHIAPSYCKNEVVQFHEARTLCFH